MIRTKTLRGTYEIEVEFEDSEDGIQILSVDNSYVIYNDHVMSTDGYSLCDNDGQTCKQRLEINDQLQEYFSLAWEEQIDAENKEEEKSYQRDKAFERSILRREG